MNNIIDLKRSYLDNCTLGKWTIEGKFICYSIELPWISNTPYVSCIPPGEYAIKPINTPKRLNVFYLSNPNLGVGLNKGDATRFGILVHVANFIRNIQGCLGPGLELHPKYWGVADSRLAMKLLNTIITDDTWKIRII